jgi:hypothetical protein
MEGLSNATRTPRNVIGFGNRAISCNTQRYAVQVLSGERQELAMKEENQAMHQQ